MLRNQRGFTLIELIVTMAVFIVVIMISTDAFKVIITQSSKLMHSEESNIEGMIGLEQLRHDLQEGGFGLPYDLTTAPPQYSEAADTPASTYNDAPSGVPRAFSSGNNLSGMSNTGEDGIVYNIVNNSDYLSIRGSSVGISNTSQRWTYLRYSSASPLPHTWSSAAENIANNARVIVLRRAFAIGGYTNQLVTDTAQLSSGNTYYSPQYNSTGFAATNFNPVTPNDVYFIYGIDDNNIRMPFNRTDYFVATPAASGSMPAVCAPSTGILYKTSVLQADGKLSYIPLVDCVADMQIVYGWDLRNAGASGTDGLIDTYSNADGTTVVGEAPSADVQTALASADGIRNSLKLIKIYLLVQNGSRDSNYTSPTADFELFDRDNGESSLGRTYTLAANQMSYRWKIYRLVVRPKNLLSNQ